MTKLRTVPMLLTVLCLCAGIASAGSETDSSNKQDSPPPTGDPRTQWNTHLESCKEESRVWITNRSTYSDGPFYYPGRSITYQKEELVKLRYYFIVAQGSTRWAEISREYKENGTVTHALEYDLKTTRWRNFDPREPGDGPSEPEQPFALHQAKGQAHPLLTSVARWELDCGLFFDGRHHTDVYAFAKNHVLDREIIRNIHNDKSSTFTQFRGREHHHAWEGIIHLGDLTQTYSIDPVQKAMMFSTLQPVGDHTWFWGHRYLRDVKERLYEFDRSPFDDLSGKVTVTQREGDPPMGTPIKQTKATVEFKTSKTRIEGDRPHTCWDLVIQSNPSEQLTRIAWDGGPDFFILGYRHQFDIWQAKDK